MDGVILKVGLLLLFLWVARNVVVASIRKAHAKKAFTDEYLDVLNNPVYKPKRL